MDADRRFITSEATADFAARSSRVSRGSVKMASFPLPARAGFDHQRIVQDAFQLEPFGVRVGSADASGLGFKPLERVDFGFQFGDGLCRGA